MARDGHDGSDVAAADDAQHLAGDLDAHEAVLLPLAGLGRGIGGRNLPGQREHQGDGVFGRGDGIAEGRVHHDHALGGRGRDVDVVDPDAGPAHHFQPGGRFEQLRRHLGGRADRQAVVLADDGRERLLVEAGLHVDLDAPFLEDRDGGGREFV